MGQAVIHLHPPAPAKPVLGAPCNGCGVCCAFEPCPLGAIVSRSRSGACRALRWDGEHSRYRCGLAAAPLDALPALPRWLAPAVARLARRWISAGSGCDCSLETRIGTPQR
jgi:hypothetical protein